MCPQVQRQWYRKRILQTGWLKIGPKTRPHFGWNRCAQNRCGVPMHQARGLEKHLPNKLVEDVARRASLTDPPLEETDLFRSSVCFQVQRQGSRKRMLQTGWLKRGPKTRPHFGWNRCVQNRCRLPVHQTRGHEKHLPNQLAENAAPGTSLTDPPFEDPGFVKTGFCPQGIWKEPLRTRSGT